MFGYELQFVPTSTVMLRYEFFTALVKASELGAQIIELVVSLELAAVTSI